MLLLSTKHQRSSTVQVKGLTNEGRHRLLLLHKRMTKEAELLHEYIMRAKLTVYEVGLLSQILKLNIPIILFEEPLNFIAHRHIIMIMVHTRTYVWMCVHTCVHMCAHVCTHVQCVTMCVYLLIYLHVKLSYCTCMQCFIIWWQMLNLSMRGRFLTSKS